MTDRERRQLIQDLQAAVQQKMDAEDKPWIMESPDGGRTISRRKFGEKEKFYLSNINGKWYNYEDALEAVRRQDREADLRAEHPSLNDAWLIYQALLAMIEPELCKDKNDKV